MTELVKTIAEWSALLTEGIGIAIIAVMAVYSVILAAVNLFRKNEEDMIFREVRQRLGQSILLGLEFLVASDIIHTVAVELTMETVSVLAIIVLIRTFLSFTLEVELTGRWPWKGET
jgi:uncharacterized membrane protein